MVGVAPPARPAPPAEVRELGAAGRAVARRCEDRAEGHRRGRGLASRASALMRDPTGENPPKFAKPGRVHTVARARSSRTEVTRVWGPPVGPAAHPSSSCTSGRAPRVGDVERRTASGERHDVIDGQVARLGGRRAR